MSKCVCFPTKNILLHENPCPEFCKYRITKFNEVTLSLFQTSHSALYYSGRCDGASPFTQNIKPNTHACVGLVLNKCKQFDEMTSEKKKTQMIYDIVS